MFKPNHFLFVIYCVIIAIITALCVFYTSRNNVIKFEEKYYMIQTRGGEVYDNCTIQEFSPQVIFTTPDGVEHSNPANETSYIEK